MAVVADNRTPNFGLPLPFSENWLSEDVIRLAQALVAIDAVMKGHSDDIAARALTGHVHDIAQITGLTMALAAKAAIDHAHALSSLTDVDVGIVALGQYLRWNGAKWVPGVVSADDIKAGTIDPARLPAIAISDTFVVGSQAEMLALSVERGDIAVRTDLKRSFILRGNNPATLADWTELLTPTDAVLSVAGLTGSITADALRAALSALRYDAEQSLTEAQRGQTRANIGGGVLAGLRNRLINGDFGICQRATTQTMNGFGSFDRWGSGFSGGSQSVSRQGHTPGQTAVPGEPRYFYRNVFVGGAGSSDYHIVVQNIEDVRTLAGKRATITFHAKANASRSISCEITQSFGIGGSTGVTGIGVRKFAIGTTWTKCQSVVDIPSLAGKTVGDASFLAFNLWLSSGVSNASRNGNIGVQSGTIDISHVSIVEGDCTADADPFDYRHIQQELALCQRYYEIITPYFVGYQTAGNWLGNNYQFSVPKRTAAPVITHTYTDVANGSLNSPRISSVSIGITMAAAATGVGSFILTTAIDAEF